MNITKETINAKETSDIFFIIGSIIFIVMIFVIFLELGVFSIC
jgi:hypothetical protein